MIIMANSTNFVTMFATSSRHGISNKSDELAIIVSVSTGVVEEISSLIRWEREETFKFSKPRKTLLSENHQPEVILSKIFQQIPIPFTLENIHWGLDFLSAGPATEDLDDIIADRLSKIARDCAASKDSCMKLNIRMLVKVSPEEYQELLDEEKEKNNQRQNQPNLNDWLLENQNEVNVRTEWRSGFIYKLQMESPKENKCFGVRSVAVKEDDNPFFGLCDEEEIMCCSICIRELKKGKQAIRLPCSHIFHGFCIFRWLSKNPTCPICRSELFTLAEKARIMSGQ